MRFELRLLCIASLLLLLVALFGPKQAIAEVRRGMDGPFTLVSGRGDFDFLAGSWEVLNRRLKVRHAGSRDWDEFRGRASMRPILGGLGNVDEISFPTKGWSGVTLRLFNPQTGQWSIYWVNSRDGVMLPPVVGSFRNGVGEFFGDDVDDGKPVRVRYLWSRITKDSARWEQAFSLDGGRTWETNWVMDLLRIR